MNKKLMTAVIAAAMMGTMAGAVTAQAEEDKFEIAVMVKGTDSDFWQQVLVGALNFEFEHSDEVHVTTYGPLSEADTAEQTELMDNIVTSGPDAIVLAPTLPDNCAAGIDAATEAGIPVAIIDNKPSTDNYVAMFATDAESAGYALGEKVVGELEARGVELKGKFGLISPMAGQDTVIKRETGFINALADLAPDIEVLEPIYTDNDIPKSLTAAEDIYTANQDDLIGYFCSNNMTGDGLAQFMTQNDLGDKLVAVAFDSDAAEIEAVKSGALYAIAVQSPYNMGYMGCDCVLSILKGEKTADDFEKFVDTGINLVDGSNVNDPEMEGVLDPFTLKLYE